MIESKYLLVSLLMPFLAMALSATEYVTIITALGAFLVILGGQVVNIIVAWRASTKVDQTNAKVDQTLTAAEVIKGHVNSEKTAAEGRENTLKRENELLREALTEKTQVAAVLAAGGPHGAAVPSSAGSSLANIDVNTKDTADNTARTEATVQGLKDDQ